MRQYDIIGLTTGELRYFRHVLLDADGVLQHLPGDWHAALEPYPGAGAGGGPRRVRGKRAGALRANGYGIHLATNRERDRAACMRQVLGYDALLDVSCYSCELGVAKPDPAFFTEAARRIGGHPSAMLFIDHSATNVEGARAAGLAAEQWSFQR